MQMYCFRILIDMLLFTGLLSCMQTGGVNNKPGKSKQEFNASFEIKSDSVWKIPAHEKQTKIYLSLEITNHENNPVRFPIMDKINISVQYPGEKELTMEGGQDVLIPGNPISNLVSSGEKYLIVFPAELIWGNNNQLQLRIEDGFGSIWYITPLKEGQCKIILHYKSNIENNKSDPDLWSGLANIEPTTIQIIR